MPPFKIALLFAIVISNGILLHKLFMKRCKTRPDKIFITLSCSDISVSLFSIAIISIPLFTQVSVLLVIPIPWFGSFQHVFFTTSRGYYLLLLHLAELVPSNIYMFNANNRNTRKRREICSKLTIETPERRSWLWKLLLTIKNYC